MIKALPCAKEAPASADLVTADHLHDELRRLAASSAGYYAVHFELPSIDDAALGSAHMRSTLRSLKLFSALQPAKFFCLPDGHVLLVCHDTVPVDQVEAALSKLRSPYLDAAWSWGGAEESDADWYDLGQPEDLEKLFALTTAWAATARPQIFMSPAGVPGVPPYRNLKTEDLGAICQRLEQANLASVVRQQTALDLSSDKFPALLFRETYVSMQDLCALVAPEIDMSASNWLFRYVTEVLDRRMLDFVAIQRLGCTPVPISLNLNLASLTTCAFKRFLKAHDAHVSKPIIEIQLVDLLAHGALFARIRPTFQAQGYKILIDGLAPPALQAIDLSTVRPDFVKIWWREDTPSMFQDCSASNLRDVIDRVGRGRIILARAESEQALKWGMKHGIRRFQGRFIDRLLGALAGKNSRSHGG